jgi:hypothetical protein
MLASEGAVPVGSAWAFEFTWDGLRALAYLTPDRVRLVNATERLITHTYPELAAMAGIAERHGPLLLDGKIVALDQLRRPSSALLRQRSSNPAPSETLRASVPVQFYLADVLYLDGRPTVDLPYHRRRELLGELDLTGSGAVLPPYFLDTDGQTVLHAAQRHGLPGVVAKRLDSTYQGGRRSKAWVETVPRHTQRVVVGGWQPRPGEPETVEALLVGVPVAAGLRYLGRITVGLDARATRALAPRLTGLARADPPFTEPPPEADARGARWLMPSLVGEISYRRQEDDGLPRHAGWLGLVTDAHPASVRGPLAPDGEPVPPDGPGRSVESVDQAASSELASLDEAVRLAQAEVRALRAQISPHFVYNALTTIASYVRTDPPRARELLLAFAEYTRYSFRSGAEHTTLGAELANADRYLGLEGARFGERLQVKRDVDDGLDDVPVPFLAVQPLVENAVRHGIEGTPRGGTVTISARRQGELCVLTVSDDGLGVDPARLTPALTDVRDRLRSAPGPAAAMEVAAGPDSGTTVTLRLPLDPGRLDR